MGLTSRSLVRRLRAWHIGEPVVRGTTIHHYTAKIEERLLVAFVKMGGETRPWGMVWREGRQRAVFRFVPEPRTRQAVDDFTKDFVPVLARHLWHPDHVDTAPTEHAELLPLSQVWFPNRSHVDMLHHFAYAYSRRPLDRPHAAELRLLGRASLYLFLESQRPGQQVVMSASDVLRSAYDFPAQDTRQAHLGFLLAWLETRGSREEGLAAALEAEQRSVSTALQPTLERKPLAQLVERYDKAREADDGATMKDVEKEIGSILRTELEHRLDLVERTIEVVESDPRPVNGGVEELVRESAKSMWFEFLNPEIRALESGREPYTVSPETDFSATSAVRRFFHFDAAADRMFSALVHHDRELEAEAIATGRAFRGTVVRVTDEGVGRSTIPVLSIEDPSPGPMSLRRGDRVCIVGNRKREGVIRSMESTHGGGLVVELLITGRKTAQTDVPWPHAMHGADERWVGQVISIIGTSFATMTEKKAMRIWKVADSAGNWALALPDQSGAEAERAEGTAELAAVEE